MEEPWVDNAQMSYQGLRTHFSVREKVKLTIQILSYLNGSRQAWKNHI